MRSNVGRLVPNHVAGRGSENVTAEKRDRRAWELAGQLAQIDSFDPGAYENQIKQWIYERLTRKIEEKAGALKNRIESVQEEIVPDCLNLMVHVLGGEEVAASSLVYMYHMDTVVLREGWEEDTSALGAVVKEDHLYGRGACDMKSGLACALPAFSDMAELTGNTGEFPVWPFIFIGTVDEGDFMRGVEYAIRDGWVGRKDWILDTEPTDEQIQVAHKDRTWSELTIQGVIAHTSNLWKDADAVAAMAEAICHIRKAIGSCPVHEGLGMSTVTFRQITGGYRPYVAPDPCKVWIDIRLVLPTDAAAAKNIVEETVGVAEAEIVGVRGSYTVTGDCLYMEKDSGSRLLAGLKSVCNCVTGEDTYIGSFNGYADTAVVTRTLDNRSCMSYGPGSLELVHKPNEYVLYEDMCRYRHVPTESARQKAFFPFVF